MKIGPHTVSRGTLLPYKTEGRTLQGRLLAEDGSVTIIERVFKEKYFKAKIRVPTAEAATIAYYLENGVNYASLPFTLEDGDGVSWTVRYWDKKLVQTRVAWNLIDLDLLFRVEVVT